MHVQYLLEEQLQLLGEHVPNFGIHLPHTLAQSHGTYSNARSYLNTFVSHLALFALIPVTVLVCSRIDETVHPSQTAKVCCTANEQQGSEA